MKRRQFMKSAIAGARWLLAGARLPASHLHERWVNREPRIRE